MLGNWSALWLSARKDIRFSATPLGWSAMFQQSQCQRHKYGRPHGEEGLPRPITGIAISGLLGPHGAAFLGRLKSQCTQAKRAQVEKPSQPKPKLAKPPFKATAEGVCPRLRSVFCVRFSVRMIKMHSITAKPTTTHSYRPSPFGRLGDNTSCGCRP